MICISCKILGSKTRPSCVLLMDPYGFQHTNVATTLAYANTKKAVRDSVEADNKINSKTGV